MTIDMTKFVKTKKTGKSVDPKTYIMYKLSTQPEEYQFIRTLRNMGVDVEALVFALLKENVKIDEPKTDAETDKKK